MNQQLIISDLIPEAGDSVSTRASFWRRHSFELTIGVFVIVMSFFYGISAGLAKHKSKAWAGVADQFDLTAENAPLRRIKLPQGVTAVPLGRDVTINNQAAEMVSFVSARSAKELVDEQMAAWKDLGMKVVGTATENRGFVIAFNAAQSERYSFSAWSVPPAMRPAVSGGQPVSGLIAVADAGTSAAASDGTVPDVPLMQGGKAGAVFSALDPGGRSYTGVYTNPASLNDSVEFYRDELASGGWKEVSTEISIPQGARFEVANGIFRRGPEQIVLLFSPAKDSALNEAGDKTVVSVTRGPFDMEKWRAPK